MSKSSPGPWHQAGSVLRNNIYDANGAHVATTTVHDAGAFVHANARLIAAAPRMLELLREIEAEPNDMAWKADIRALLAEIDGEA